MGETINQRRYEHRKRLEKKLFLIGCAVGSLWFLSIWFGGWLIFLFKPEAYDMLNDSIGLPLDEWIHVTFRPYFH